MKITKSELTEMIREALREELEEGIFGFGNKYKGKLILVCRAGGKDEAIAIADNKAGNYNLIHFKKAHAKKNGNKESDYATVSGAGDAAVKKYKQALKSVPDVSANLPSWVKKYMDDESKERDHEFRRAEAQKEREAEARRAEARRKAQTNTKKSDDDYTYVKGNGFGTYKYNDRY